MSLVGKPERETQSRVIALFRDELHYRYLGDRADRPGNSNIGERGQTVDSPGAIYHAMDRGGRREDMFVDDGKGETVEQKGNRVIAEELARLGWQESNLASRRKPHPDKLAIALRLGNETTLSIKWIVARVRIGSSKGANSVLERWVHSQDKTAAVQPKACAQLEFQSTV
jgi:hypothetical protein